MGKKKYIVKREEVNLGAVLGAFIGTGFIGIMGTFCLVFEYHWNFLEYLGIILIMLIGTFCLTYILFWLGSEKYIEI